MKCDVAVVGGGIVGLATARSLLQTQLGLSVVVLEKETSLALHQTGHNSGVIHTGIYYRPGSLKAALCISGSRQIMAFCAEHDIPFDQCGKVIIATTEAQLPALAELERRGQENQVPGLRRIDTYELHEIEPHAVGIAALYSPTTAIVDYRAVSAAIADDVQQLGGEIRTGYRVDSVDVSTERVGIQTVGGRLFARALVNCAGLYSDTLARKMGAVTDIRIVPFRGEYYTLRRERRDLVRGLIYPTPDPRFPFLGVHFTRTIGGSVEAGPNAVPAFAREGYSWRAINLGEALATLRFSGSRSLARTYWKTGAYEIVRSLSKRSFARSLQTLVPGLQPNDLVRGGAGVRAQAVASNGTLLDDFEIVKTDRAIHVLNAPSPAATASLAIGAHIANLTSAELVIR